MKQPIHERLEAIPRPSKALRHGVSMGLRIGLGVVGIFFFTLTALGLLVSPNKLQLLVPAILIAGLLLASVRLLRSGLADYGSGKTRKDALPPLEEVAGPAQPITDGEEWADAPPVACNRCGAVGIPDENGCCEYCGSRLEE